MPLCAVLQTFLPQLLVYPNPADPLNGEAAALLMNTPEDYAKRVKGTVASFAFCGCLPTFPLGRCLCSRRAPLDC